MIAIFKRVGRTELSSRVQSELQAGQGAHRAVHMLSIRWPEPNPQHPLTVALTPIQLFVFFNTQKNFLGAGKNAQHVRKHAKSCLLS